MDAVTDAATDAEMMAVVGFGSSFFFASAAVAAALVAETDSAAKQNIKQGPILSLDRALFSFINGSGRSPAPASETAPGRMPPFRDFYSVFSACILHQFHTQHYHL